MTFSNIDLSRELVQAVRDAIDIVDIASEHTKLEKKGRDHQGVCPLHKEKTPSFHVDADRGLFYCFGCGAGGDAIKLHMLTSGDDFPAAIESLALRYGIPVRERRKRRPDEPDPERALAAAAEYFVEQLGRHDVPQRYLEERKVSPELAETYGIGYAPDSWRALLETLAKRVPQRDLEAAGLVRRSKQGKLYDHFRNRLVFPIHNPSGRLVGFGGRTLGDDRAKYVNTAETERFHKSELLYGLFQARRDIRDGHRAVLVEGYFDVIGAAAAGVVGAVATMGTALTPEQSKLLGRYAEEVVVAYDGDDAGERAHQRALPILLGEGMAVYRARFPDGHDPDSLRLAEGNAAVVKAVGDAGDSVLAEIRRLTPAEARSQPQRQAQAASDLAGLLGGIPDAVLRFSYA
ncbi:MAG TPA: DNA primase, partial [Thermoanaerobaculia bacterium]|nr:DNA primase [Thermoanaerobaculia bacterium]